MNMEIFKTILLFAGGLGMFLHGMDLMAEGLQKAAGDKTRKLLEALTSNPVMGLAAGALVTAIIQSSSAATVMVVGFVNAGLMSLVQACSVIMGANIGTTMTSWIVSMGEWASFLKPEMIAPILLMAGVVMSMSARSSRLKDGSKILIGFGILFTGLSAMSGSITPYADAPIFQNIFETLGSNPLLAILAGAGVTAIIQSSSASLGILQTMAMAGAVNWGSAVFIALGQNIGTCVTALISALSGDTNAKRAAMIHLEFNVIGAVLVGAAATVFFMLVPSMTHAGINSSGLAIFHTSFNLIVTLALFPFRKQLVSLSEVMIGNEQKGKKKKEALLLDSRLQSIPSAALGAMFKELDVLREKCIRLISDSRAALIDNSGEAELRKLSKAVQNECYKVKKYCAGIPVSTLTKAEQKKLQRILLSARDLHQIAAKCLAIGTINEESMQEKVFTESMIEEINTLSSLCQKALSHMLLEINAQPSSAQDERVTAQRLQVRQDEEEIRLRIADLRKAHFETVYEAGDESASAWLFYDVADLYEQISRRILRLSDEDAWSQNARPEATSTAIETASQPVAEPAEAVLA